MVHQTAALRFLALSALNSSGRSFKYESRERGEGNAATSRTTRMLQVLLYGALMAVALLPSSLLMRSYLRAKNVTVDPEVGLSKTFGDVAPTWMRAALFGLWALVFGAMVTGLWFLTAD